jgi:protein-S-isoprenylcysteine O-methyltransferase Ste14
MTKPPKLMIPPTVFVLAALTMVALDRMVPLARPIPSPWTWLGLAAVTAALALAGSAAWRFRRAGTPVRPFVPSTALVTDGPYRRTRNPMYVGLTLLLIGLAIALGTLSPWAVVPVFVFAIDRLFIVREEAILEQRFGQAYRAYRSSVRRWL